MSSANVGNGTKASSELITKLQSELTSQLASVGTNLADFVLLDFPNYANVGDSAIWLGELAYFKASHNLTPAYVSSRSSPSWTRLEELAGPIFLSGGGNFGDLWPAHQRFREAVLERFPARPVVQLPQSIHFEDPAASLRTARAIEKHGNFTLLVRDKRSLEFALKTFSCSVYICPDMALFLGPISRRRTPIRPIMCLLRDDKERALSEEAPQDLFVVDWTNECWAISAASKAVGTAEQFTTVLGSIYERIAYRRLARGIALLSSGQVVVTDRLHGHILCLLLGIPHVILDNSYGKISAFIEQWTAESPLVARASSLEGAILLARSMAEVDDKKSTSARRSTSGKI